MLKKKVVAHFGTQEKVAEFITSKGTPYGRTSIVQWRDLIPIKWALYLDKHSPLKFEKKLYQAEL